MDIYSADTQSAFVLIAFVVSLITSLVLSYHRAYRITDYIYEIIFFSVLIGVLWPVLLTLAVLLFPYWLLIVIGRKIRISIDTHKNNS